MPRPFWTPREERLLRLAHHLRRENLAMSKELDDLRSQLSATRSSIATLTSEVATMTTTHGEVSAHRDAVSAELDETKDALIGITADLKVIQDQADAAVAQTKTAGQTSADTVTGGTDTSYDLGHQPDTGTLVQSLGGADTSDTYGDQITDPEPTPTIDPNTGLPIADTAALNEPA